VYEVTLGQVSLFVLSVSPANHRSTIIPYSSITAPLRRAIALTRQHLITTSVFKLGASFLTVHLADFTVKK
jgi:hypothetical protein